MNRETGTDSEAMEECCLLTGLLLVVYAVFFLLALETNSPRVALLPVSGVLPHQSSTKRMHNNLSPSARSIFPIEISLFRNDSSLYQDDIKLASTGCMLVF